MKHGYHSAVAVETLIDAEELLETDSAQYQNVHHYLT